MGPRSDMKNSRKLWKGCREALPGCGVSPQIHSIIIKPLLEEGLGVVDLDLDLGSFFTSLLAHSGILVIF